MNRGVLSALGRSFGHALQGFSHCVRTQRNFRIHLVAMAHVFLLAPFYNLSWTGYGVLLALCALVLGAEMLNTALETVIDGLYPKYDGLAKTVKDVAAGAVFVCAFCALVAGLLLFLQKEGMLALWGFVCANPWALLIPAATLGFGLWFVFAFGTPRPRGFGK